MKICFYFLKIIFEKLHLQCIIKKGTGFPVLEKLRNQGWVIFASAKTNDSTTGPESRTGQKADKPFIHHLSLTFPKRFVIKKMSLYLNYEKKRSNKN